VHLLRGGEGDNYIMALLSWGWGGASLV
jgi:hypothetical protein